MSIQRINLQDTDNRELAMRIATRLMGQGEPEVTHTLSQLFPNSNIMRMKATAVDFSQRRESAAEIEFFGLFDSDDVDMEIFRSLSSADKEESLFRGRESYEPTKFELTLTCLRTPFKEYFDECRDEICEQCIARRVQKFETTNDLSLEPFQAKVERVEKRRLDICKSCGNILGKKDDINMQNERLLYTCSYCGHKGWTKAK